MSHGHSQIWCGSMAVKARKYNPKRDYGTRGSEVDKFTVPFAGKRAVIYRRKDSESLNWHMRVWLPKEGIHFRKSLKTSDKREAREFAEREFISLIALQQQGLKVASPTFIEIVRKFTAEDEKSLADGDITKQTFKIHQMYVRRGKEFMADNFPAGIHTRLSSIDGQRDFEKYLEWRLKKKKILRTSIEAELVGIRMLFNFAVKKRLATEKCVPVWDFDVGEASRRQRMGEKEYPTVLRIMRLWARKGEKEVDQYSRQMVLHVFLLIAAAGMRTGELMGLRNSDIHKVDRDSMEAIIHIRSTVTKVRRDRLLTIMPSIGRAGGTPINYLIRWLDECQVHKAPNDFVFGTITKGNSHAKDPLYRYYKELKESVLAEEGLGWFDMYFARHFFATQAIRAGIPMTTVAVAMGNSPMVLEKTYIHLLSESSSREIAGRRFSPMASGTEVVEQTTPLASMVSSD